MTTDTTTEPTLTVGDTYEFNGLPGQTTYSDHPDPALRVGTIIRISAITYTGRLHILTGTRSHSHTTDPRGELNYTGNDELPLADALTLIRTGIWESTY